VLQHLLGALPRQRLLSLAPSSWQISFTFAVDAAVSGWMTHLTCNVSLWKQQQQQQQQQQGLPWKGSGVTNQAGPDSSFPLPNPCPTGLAVVVYCYVHDDEGTVLLHSGLYCHVSDGVLAGISPGAFQQLYQGMVRDVAAQTTQPPSAADWSLNVTQQGRTGNSQQQQEAATAAAAAAAAMQA